MTGTFITVTEYCTRHHTDASLIDALAQSGLVSVQVQEEQRVIPYDQLKDLECYLRWYQELEINLEGIETIKYLVEKIKAMQDYIVQLEARLRQYE